MDPCELEDGVRDQIEAYRNGQGDDRRRGFKVHWCEQVPASGKRTGNRKGKADAEKEESGFLPRVMFSLTDELRQQAGSDAAGPAYWRSIGRHEAVAALLDDSQPRRGPHYVEYLRQRTLLEIAFANAKGRGVLSSVSLVNERCGRYYDIYARGAREAGTTPASWATMCGAGGLQEARDAPDCYYAHPTVCHDDAPPLPERSEPAIEHLLRPISARRLAAHVLDRTRR